MNRCPHGLNPQACLTCWSKPKPAPQQPAQQAPQRPLDPVVQAVKQATARPVPMAAEGTRPDGSPNAPEAKKMPQPVIVRAAGQRSGAQDKQPNIVAPFSYRNDEGRVDSKGIWHPPRHQEIISSKPRHPEAGKR